jgi:hypothetical protein
MIRIIPAGWIHAVYTPEDAIVIGGNFLQSFNIGTQLTVYAIEQVTDVPLKFRFPYYKRLNWYALAKFDTWLQQEEIASKLSYFELESIALLASFLRKDIKQNESGMAIAKEDSFTNTDKKQLDIPDSIEDPIGLSDRVLDLVKKTINSKSKLEKEKEPLPKKIVIRMKPPTPKPIKGEKQPKEEEEEEDVYFHDEEEEEYEEDFKLDADDDEFDVEDDDYDEEDTIPVIEDSNISNTISSSKIRKPANRKPKKKIQIEPKQQDNNDSSSSDDDSMGTSRSKSMGGISGLFSNRKRSLSNNSSSSQKSTKQRLLDRMSKRY